MFTQEQIKKLLKNKNIDKCSSKTITYSNKFKLVAVKQYYENGYGPRMIFEEAGFDLDIIGKDRVKSCLKLWRKEYNKQGKFAFSKKPKNDVRRKKKEKFKNKDEEIKYLKLKIKYLDSQNNFLAKLRGLKRE